MKFLTDADISVLSQLAREYRNRPKNQGSTTFLDMLNQGRATPSQTYIAYPQTSSGIPARSEATPGSAECDIYQVIEGILVSIGRSELVYNLTETAVEQTYITATRDKFGLWIAQVSGGGSSCTQNCIQHIVVLGELVGTAGEFDLYFLNNFSTIPYDSTAAEVEALLEANPDIGAGNVSCTGGPLPSAAVIVEFIANLAETDVPTFWADWSGLSGTGVGVVTLMQRIGSPNVYIGT